MSYFHWFHMPSSILSGLLWDIQYLTSVKAMLNLYMMARRLQGSLSLKNEWETLGLLPYQWEREDSTISLDPSNFMLG